MSGPLHLFEGCGLELEYMIVDRETLAVRPVADELLRAATGEYVSDVERGRIAWTNELVLHVIELKTNGPRTDLDGLESDLHENIRAMNGLLAGLGARLLPTGAHPLMDPLRETRLWPHEYSAVYESYDRIFDCRGHGWSNLQSAHLNLPFHGDEEFGRLHAAVRLLLPILPALSASTPVLEGRLTGNLDTRLEVYRLNQKRVPAVAGRVVPEPAWTRREYRRCILEPIYRAIAPLDPGKVLRHEWLNSRGAIARFERNTIEIRLIDMQECPSADLAVVRAVLAALRAVAAETWCPYARQRELDTGELADLLLETIRSGEHTPVRSPRYLASFGAGPPGLPAARLWRHILEGTGLWSDRTDGSGAARPIAARPTGAPGTWRPALEVILNRGTLSSRIVEALGRNPSREAILRVYRELADCLEEDRVFLPESTLP